MVSANTMVTVLVTRPTTEISSGIFMGVMVVLSLCVVHEPEGILHTVQGGERDSLGGTHALERAAKIIVICLLPSLPPQHDSWHISYRDRLVLVTRTNTANQPPGRSSTSAAQGRGTGTTAFVLPTLKSNGPMD